MSSLPYQSRILSSVLYRARQWADRSAIAFRQTKVAVSWTAQAVLYSLNAVFRTSRLIGRQLQQTVQAVMPQLGTSTQPPSEIPTIRSASASPTSDTPLQQVLLTVQALALPAAVAIAPNPNATDNRDRPTSLQSIWTNVTGKLRQRLQGWKTRFTPRLPDTAASLSLPAAMDPTSSQLTAPPTTTAVSSKPSVLIRGVASLVSSRSLVLVTNQNEVLDILSAEQQRKLQQRMSWEVAHYLRYRRIRHSTVQRLSRVLAVQPSHLLSPIHALQGAIAAIQSTIFAPEADTTNRALPQLKPFEVNNSVPSAIATVQQWGDRLINHTTALISKGLTKGQLVLATVNPTKPSQKDSETTPLSVTPPTAPAPHPLLSLPFSLYPTLTSTTSRSGESLLSVSNVCSEPTFTPDWIETPAIAIGYVPSLLDRLLHWLDRGLLWLETHVIALWQTIRKHLQ